MSAVSKSPLFALVAALIVGVVAYLAYTGVTLRDVRNWTQRQLGAYSGIDQAVICRLENGKQYGLRWSWLAALIDALGGLDVGPGAADPPGYVRGHPGAPRIDLSAGLAQGRGLDDWLDDP